MSEESDSSGGKGCVIVVIVAIVLFLTGTTMVSLVELTRTTGREQWVNAFFVVIGITCLAAMFTMFTQSGSSTTGKERK